MPLIINDKEVNYLSGPVSMYIYEPTDGYLEEFPYAPILILFGDGHNSDANYCGESAPKIFDTAFLRLISDAVAGNKEKKEQDGIVDFYLEGGDLHTTLNYYETKKFPMEQLWNLFKDCYTNSRMEGRKTILEKSKETCEPIKNIRWQSGDARFFKKYRLYDFNAYSFLESIQYVSDRYLKDKTFESEEKDEEIRKRKAFRASCIEEKKLCSIIDPKAGTIIPTTATTAKDFIDMYIENKESLIFKQLNKFKSYTDVKGEIFNMKYYTKLASLKVNTENFIKSEFKDGNISNKAKINLINDNIKNIFKYNPFSSEFESAVTSLYEQLEDKNSMIIYYNFKVSYQLCLLDLYTMARIYKTMSKSMNICPSERIGVNEAVHPLVVMCYFGNEHILNINTLIKIDYNIKEGFTVPKVGTGKDVNRCLNFTNKKDYNLNSKIRKLKTKRITYEQKLESIKLESIKLESIKLESIK